MTGETVERAVRNGIDDGDVVYFGGFGHLTPTALGHEIVRQGVRDLTAVRLVVDDFFDQLVAAGCVSRAVFAWTGGASLERAWRTGDPVPVELSEYTHFSLLARLHAGARGMPFIPVRTLLGTDLTDHNDAVRTVEDPYTGGSIPVVPPLTPDVALLHGQRGDEDGNIQTWGLVGAAADAAAAADTVIVTVEERVGRETITRDPNRTTVPASEVDYVIEVPYGAYPTYVQGYYESDERWFGWKGIAPEQEQAEAWLDEWVHDIADHTAFLQKVGIERLLGVRSRTSPAVPVSMGEYG